MQRWRAFHRPLVLPGRLTVRPPWEPAGETPIDIVIDPAQAFGTGAHHTTRLCLELLLELAGASPPSESAARGDGSGHPGGGARAPGDLGEFVDLGCGSGVLAIAAAKLGFSPVLALDHDPLSVKATEMNAARNGVALRVARHDLRSDPPATGATMAANLLAPLLSTWARRLLPADVVPGRIIASGLLADEADAVAAQFAPLGLRESARRLGGEWAALLLESRLRVGRAGRHGDAPRCAWTSGAPAILSTGPMLASPGWRILDHAVFLVPAKEVKRRCTTRLLLA